MKHAPLGYSSTAVWEHFCSWADAHSVPDEAEDWDYLWECFAAGYSAGVMEEDK